MAAASCPEGHAVLTPKGTPAPSACPVATCGRATTPRSANFAATIRAGIAAR